MMHDNGDPNWWQATCLLPLEIFLNIVLLILTMACSFHQRHHLYSLIACLLLPFLCFLLTPCSKPENPFFKFTLLSPAFQISNSFPSLVTSFLPSLHCIEQSQKHRNLTLVMPVSGCVTTLDNLLTKWGLISFQGRGPGSLVSRLLSSSCSHGSMNFPGRVKSEKLNVFTVIPWSS